MMRFRDKQGELWPSYIIGTTQGQGRVEMKAGVPTLVTPIQAQGQHRNRIQSSKFDQVMPEVSEQHPVNFTLISINPSVRSEQVEVPAKGGKTKTITRNYFDSMGEFVVDGIKIRKQMKLTVSANDRDSKTPLLLLKASCELSGKELGLKQDARISATVEMSGIDASWTSKKKRKK